jgi:hypothetical protein
MSAPPAAIAAGRRGAPPPVSWRSWPLEEGGLSAWLLSTIAVAIIVAVGLTTGSVQWALFACGALAASAWRFFVPTHFELNAQGVFQEVLGRKRRVVWRAFDSAELCREGVYLRFAGASFGLSRGMYIPWGSHRAEVVACVDYYLTQVRQPDRVYGFEIGR